MPLYRVVPQMKTGDYMGYGWTQYETDIVS